MVIEDTSKVRIKIFEADTSKELEHFVGKGVRSLVTERIHDIKYSHTVWIDNLGETKHAWSAMVTIITN